jgi:hypothetical protein
VKVSLKLYGANAQTLIRELGLQNTAETTLPMTARFVKQNVEGHAVVAVSFESRGA